MIIRGDPSEKSPEMDVTVHLGFITDICGNNVRYFSIIYLLSALSLTESSFHIHSYHTTTVRRQRLYASRAGAMSIRKRMSLSSLRRKNSSGERAGGGDSNVRRSSLPHLSSWVGSSGGGLKWAAGVVQATAAKAMKDLFVDFEEQDDGSDVYGTLCAQRSQSQRAEFEARCVWERRSERGRAGWPRPVLVKRHNFFAHLRLKMLS